MEKEIYMPSEDVLKKLGGFRRHGFKFSKMSGDQAVGTCPFTDKENHFYINTKNLLWDSKTANLHGNFLSFLAYVQKRNQYEVPKNALLKLSLDRGLHLDAFKGSGIGFYDGTYTLPIYNSNGSIQDLRCYNIGKRIFSTKGTEIGLYNFPDLLKLEKHLPIYLCEGEWDAIAFKYLLKLNKRRGVVLGVPGANTFKGEWVEYFRNREVNVLYDNDEAGKDGEHQVIKKLQKAAKKLKFLHWPEKNKSGYDVRDFVVTEAIKNKRPKRCLKALVSLLKDIPRKPLDESEDEEILKSKDLKLPPVDTKMNWEKLSKIIRSWLKVRNLHPFLVSSAVVLSNSISGDPVWMFIVASPGEGKSETLATFKMCREVYTTSSLTPNALISGAIVYKGKEPSLLPKLNGKTLCIKDFSTIQTMRETDRDSLLGILRDAYDGSAGKVFGTGEEKHFDSKFSILAGTTPAVYELDNQFSALGERFLKFFIGEYVEHRGQLDVILRAMGNVGREDKMRTQLSEAMYSFIENMKNIMTSDGYVEPQITEEMELKIAYLAAWCSLIKGVVNRDKYERDIITNKAYSEVGTRTGKQLKRLLLCLPTVITRGKAEEEDFDIIKKVALDTVSAKREDIFRTIYLNCPDKNDSVDLKKIIDTTRYPYPTCSRVVDDLIALGIVDRMGKVKPFQYKISDKVLEFAHGTKLYKDSLTKNRISRAIALRDLSTKNAEPKGK